MCLVLSYRESGIFTLKRPTSAIVLWALLTGLLVYIGFSIAAEATLDQRRRLLAYATLFAAAVFATALPHALIPDRLLNTHQLFNIPPFRLLNIQFKKWRLWILTVSVPIIVITFSDLFLPFGILQVKITLLAAHLSLVFATGFYAFHVYYSIGPQSQQWQEGIQGGWWDRIKALNPAIVVGVPRGLLPALIATAKVFSISVLFVISSMYLGSTFGDLHALWPGLIMLAWSGRKLYQLRIHFDRYYYHTNAFYGEMLRSGSFLSTVKETTPFEALYWVPSRWRPHVWASFVQLERAVPIGRFVVLSILLIWILAWSDVSQPVLSACLLLLIVAKNLSILVFRRGDLAAPLLTHSMQSYFHWSITRGFVNLKWTLPLSVSLLPVAWLDSEFHFSSLGLWTLADIFCSFIFAFCITYGTTYRERPVLSG